MPFTVQALTLDDIPAALSIQAAVYPSDLHDNRDAFASRLALPLSYCLAAVIQGELVAYLLAHGWVKGAPPRVNSTLSRTAATDVLYIHDLAVAPPGRGLKIGSRLVEQAFALGRRDGLSQAELVAVGGAATYWRTLGFFTSDTSSTIAAIINGYGPDAQWMTACLG